VRVGDTQKKAEAGGSLGQKPPSRRRRGGGLQGTARHSQVKHSKTDASFLEFLFFI
jgi:hypothetical protein